jgi:hypothetical protein
MTRNPAVEVKSFIGESMLAQGVSGRHDPVLRDSSVVRPFERIPDEVISAILTSSFWELLDKEPERKVASQKGVRYPSPLVNLASAVCSRWRNLVHQKCNEHLWCYGIQIRELLDGSRALSQLKHSLLQAGRCSIRLSLTTPIWSDNDPLRLDSYLAARNAALTLVCLRPYLPQIIEFHFVGPLPHCSFFNAIRNCPGLCNINASLWVSPLEGPDIADFFDTADLFDLYDISSSSIMTAFSALSSLHLSIREGVWSIADIPRGSCLTELYLRDTTGITMLIDWVNFTRLFAMTPHLGTLKLYGPHWELQHECQSSVKIPLGIARLHLTVNRQLILSFFETYQLVSLTGFTFSVPERSWQAQVNSSKIASISLPTLTGLGCPVFDGENYVLMSSRNFSEDLILGSLRDYELRNLYLSLDPLPLPKIRINSLDSLSVDFKSYNVVSLLDVYHRLRALAGMIDGHINRLTVELEPGGELNPEISSLEPHHRFADAIFELKRPDSREYIISTSRVWVTHAKLERPTLLNSNSLPQAEVVSLFLILLHVLSTCSTRLRTALITASSSFHLDFDSNLTAGDATHRQDSRTILSDEVFLWKECDQLLDTGKSAVLAADNPDRYVGVSLWATTSHALHMLRMLAPLKGKKGRIAMIFPYIRQLTVNVVNGENAPSFEVLAQAVKDLHAARAVYLDSPLGEVVLIDRDKTRHAIFSSPDVHV